MFENIRKCLDEYEKVANDINYLNITQEESDIINFFALHFSQAIMKDLPYNNYDESIAKIILAAKGLSNEVKVKVE